MDGSKWPIDGLSSGSTAIGPGAVTRTTRQRSVDQSCPANDRLLVAAAGPRGGAVDYGTLTAWRMTPSGVTALLHVVGFLTASALYILLAAMTLGTRARPRAAAALPSRSDLIPLGTALLGLVWNVGELVMYGLHATATDPPAWLVVAAFAALSYLPAVVVHSALVAGPALPPSDRRSAATDVLVAAAYTLSTVATALNLLAAWRGAAVPSGTSLLVLSIGFVILVAGMLAYVRRQPAWRRALLPAAAVATFAIMMAHLTHHALAPDQWGAELVGHHGSLLVVLVILYQDYRFALADLFLKRAVTLLAVTAVAAALYTGIVVPLLLPRLGGASGAPADPLAESALLALWVACALAYPALRRAVARFVDAVLLRRPDTHRLLGTLSAATASLQSADQVLDAACSALAPALSATRVTWSIDAGAADSPAASQGVFDGEGDGSPPAGANGSGAAATRGRAMRVTVPTVDPLGYVMTVGPLVGGRRLLSDDLQLLEGVAALVARRIDALRVARERWERDTREQQIVRLATEAELRALRAQLNPHFLFNALTTIGHLVREAPDRALDTLFRLTDVLRAVLKRSDGEFTTLGEELEIVSAYLAIEHARFEDRLRVTIDVPATLAPLRVPPLLLQPLVENAVKHGIAPVARGGCIVVSARAERTSGRGDADAGTGDHAAGHGDRLRLTVSDTGMGAAPTELAARRAAGIGLSNIERRLERCFGDAASLAIRSAAGLGTTVDICLPIRSHE